jgi:hypothetical protein
VAMIHCIHSFPVCFAHVLYPEDSRNFQVVLLFMVLRFNSGGTWECLPDLRQ